MTRKEAILAMLDGDKIWHPRFGKENFMWFDKVNFCFKSTVNILRGVEEVSLRSEQGYELYEEKYMVTDHMIKLAVQHAVFNPQRDPGTAITKRLKELIEEQKS